jgi:hypothetical protein
VCPACSMTRRWKSSGNQVVGTRAKRKAKLVRGWLKEAWSETREPTNRNRIGGGREQGERATDREALTIKAQRS